MPTILLAGYIAVNPLSNEEHAQMASILKTEFNEVCYMSCGRLNSSASIIQNFQHNVGKYSFEVLLRYFLIILIGFGPLFILLINSKLKSENLFFFLYRISRFCCRQLQHISIYDHRLFCIANKFFPAWIFHLLRLMVFQEILMI